MENGGPTCTAEIIIIECVRYTYIVNTQAYKLNTG